MSDRVLPCGQSKAWGRGMVKGDGKNIRGMSKCQTDGMASLQVAKNYSSKLAKWAYTPLKGMAMRRAMKSNPKRHQPGKEQTTARKLKDVFLDQ